MWVDMDSRISPEEIAKGFYLNPVVICFKCVSLFNGYCQENTFK